MKLFLVADSTAVSSGWNMSTGNIYNDILIILLVVVLIVLLFTALSVSKAIKSILKITMPEVLLQEQAAKVAAKQARKIKWSNNWKKIMGLRPISEEKDIVIDHSYDGIKELDNPIPIWFNALFYSTITFGIIYLLVYHVFGWGLNQDQEYVREVAQAEKAKQEYLAQVADLIDETSITVDETGAYGCSGKAIFAANCSACHGQAGEGGIGPNLTDRFWLHGGEIKDVFKTVKYGVPDKGMVPWEQTLSPAQIAEVSNYIVSIRDTKPGNPKEPQGAEVEYASAEKDAEAETDTTAVQ
ncbi:putative cytochrome c oxidase, cbb3-type, subunit III [Sphingobacterium spiritivorum ATCC 33300]|uniref:Putative cytochrome c oxidase, cbb3-type, subunit III n=1 Tax=Sphingobacterium spiritivorum ATCC 33300 TaxID=525372 RepID=C2G5N2_SPHSI|nr:cbb3-type cytochrome c oxidase N-terminal domain-containing protein [Sphingobacterium spiritivorum]EEI89521.1 putative cytochrome c oxidase, cbb3-type, subunit III [Sphingobacterium spiritivorum ATCC 33300]